MTFPFLLSAKAAILFSPRKAMRQRRGRWRGRPSKSGAMSPSSLLYSVSGTSDSFMVISFHEISIFIIRKAGANAKGLVHAPSQWYDTGRQVHICRAAVGGTGAFLI